MSFVLPFGGGSFFSFFCSLKEPPRGDGAMHADDDLYKVYKVGIFGGGGSGGPVG